MFIEDSVTIATYQKGGTPFHRKDGDKKQAHIMIHPLERNLKLPARGAGPRLLLNGDRFRLNPAYKEEH